MNSFLSPILWLDSADVAMHEVANCRDWVRRSKFASNTSTSAATVPNEHGGVKEARVGGFTGPFFSPLKAVCDSPHSPWKPP